MPRPPATTSPTFGSARGQVTLPLDEEHLLPSGVHDLHKIGKNLQAGLLKVCLVILNVKGNPAKEHRSGGIVVDDIAALTSVVRGSPTNTLTSTDAPPQASLWEEAELPPHRAWHGIRQCRWVCPMKPRDSTIFKVRFRRRNPLHVSNSPAPRPPHGRNRHPCHSFEGELSQKLQGIIIQLTCVHSMTTRTIIED